MMTIHTNSDGALLEVELSGEVTSSAYNDTLIPAIEAALAFVWRQALAVQRHGGGLEGLVISATEDFLPVKSQQTVLGPLVAVDQQALTITQ